MKVVKEILGHAHLSTTTIHAPIPDEIVAQETTKMLLVFTHGKCYRFRRIIRGIAF